MIYKACYILTVIRKVTYAKSVRDCWLLISDFLNSICFSVLDCRKLPVAYNHLASRVALTIARLVGGIT